MDTTLSKAIKRRQELLAELKKLDSFIDLYQQIFGDEGVETVPVTEVEPTQSADESAAPRRRPGKPAEIADAAERAIRRVGHPLPRGRLVDEIEAEGVEIHSDDKARYVGTILWRKGDRFVNLEGQGYWLKDEPLNESGLFDKQ